MGAAQQGAAGVGIGRLGVSGAGFDQRAHIAGDPVAELALEGLHGGVGAFHGGHVDAAKPAAAGQ